MMQWTIRGDLKRFPDESTRNRIGQTSNCDVSYSDETQEKLVTGQEQLDSGWADHEAGHLKTSIAKLRAAVRTFEEEPGEQNAYVAWIIRSEGRGDVIAVDVGLAESIDRRVRNTLQAIHSEKAVATISSDGEQVANDAVREELAALAAKVLQPLLPNVDGVEELILSPDGQLWTIPWAALPVSEEEYALKRFRIRLSVSGRELATDQADSTTAPIQKSAPLIVVDPRFDMSAPSTLLADNHEAGNRLRSGGKRFSDAFRNAKPLRGTAAEAKAIKGSVESLAGMAPKMFLQQTAEESVIKSARSPYCLVLSTHGFFFEASDLQSSASKLRRSGAVSKNPLLRCGLLLAGCRHANTAPPGTDDGILTGMEIISSDLRDTELVVLSACETSLGDLRSGEGVAGLRQAFQLAGAKSVVASLWQVEDTATARLMDEFFGNLAKGLSKSEALRQAQLSRIDAREERNGTAHPFFRAAFTLTGEN